MALALLCPGQGGQHAGLFDAFLDDAAARATLAAADRVAGIDLREAATHPSLFDNAVAQPLVCAAALVAWSALAPRLAEAGVAPAIVAGYSVGELAAHGVAGRLSADDTIASARRRARAMDDASGPDDGLLALRGATRATVDAWCAAHGAHVAIVNGDDQFIVGGVGAALDAFARAASARGASVQRLPVTVAAHTPRLAAAATRFRDDLASCRWLPSALPVVAGVDASIVVDGARAIDTLARQVATTIRWSACMDALAERGTTACLELGPGDALARMMRDRHPSIASRSVADFRTIDGIVAWLSRAP